MLSLLFVLAGDHVLLFGEGDVFLLGVNEEVSTSGIFLLSHILFCVQVIFDECRFTLEAFRDQAVGLLKPLPLVVSGDKHVRLLM